MTGVDALVAQGIADPNCPVSWAPYGGYMTNWIVTQIGRFKAARRRQPSDLSDTFYLSEGGVFMVDYFKRPENREGYAAHSPLTFADKVATPLLIQHGEADPRADRWRWKFTDAEGDGQDGGVEIHARRPRPARADAATRADAAQRGMVREMDRQGILSHRKVSRAAASPCSPQIE